MSNFEFIRDTYTRDLVNNGYRTISQLELWDWLRNYTPEPGAGFMFSTSPNIERIMQHMESQPDSPGHSGSSFAFTMRSLQYIAKNGIEKYKQQIEQNN
jgi:hypothetical protein